MRSCAACGAVLREGNENFCPYCGSGLSFTLDYSLPVNMKYEEVIKTEIQNPSAIRVSAAALEFYPYYVFDYELKIKRKDPTGKTHRIENKGKHIADAKTGQLISVEPVRKFKHLSNIIFGGYRKKDIEEGLELSGVEKNQIAQDIKNIPPNHNLSFSLSSDYRLDILKNEVTLKGSEKIVLRKIKENNTVDISYMDKRGNTDKRPQEMRKITPTYNEIKLTREYMIYVPIWIIKFKSGKISYTRKSLAASGTTVVDEISFCPRHFSFGKVLSFKKQTYAVCVICGGAFCIDHVIKVNQSYYCKEDRPLTDYSH